MNRRKSEALTDDELRQYAETHDCPRCLSPTKVTGTHERDSSNDIHRCLTCGWTCSEMALWRVLDNRTY